MTNAGLLFSDSPLNTFNAWLYQFRMPAIALVLGLFIARGVEKYGAWGYIRRRLVYAVYLYLIWYVLQMGVEVATSSLKNTPTTLEDAMRFWVPPAQLWFIPFLAVSTILVTVTRPWTRWGLITLPLLAGASAALWGAAPNVIGLRGIALVGFTALGSAIGVARFGTWLRERRLLATGTGVVALLTSLPFLGRELLPATAWNRAITGSLIEQPVLLPSMTLAVLGLILLGGLGAACGAVPGLNRALAFTGRSTLPIFLAHIIVVAGARIVLTRLGLTEPISLVVVLMLLGVLVPLAADRLVRGTPLAAVFEPPAALLHTVAPARPVAQW